jgi:hypothetical protein
VLYYGVEGRLYDLTFSFLFFDANEGISLQGRGRNDLTFKSGMRQFRRHNYRGLVEHLEYHHFGEL